MNKLLISHVDDINNIYHVFVGEIDAIWRATQGDARYSILLKHYNDNMPGRWRVDLLKSIYKNVYIKELPDGVKFEEFQEIKTWTYGMDVDYEHFNAYDPSALHIELANRVKEKYGLQNVTGHKVVYVERVGSRILFDYKTNLPLREVLEKKCRNVAIEFETVNFDSASFDDQIEALSHASILLACHGAANTNLFMLPEKAALFEINFRKFWFCDPVCSKHLSGEISYQTDCGGPLTHSGQFYKAMYHNLAHIYGVQYREFPIENAENFLNDNPISLEKIYIDGEMLFCNIKNFMFSI